MKPEITVKNMSEIVDNSFNECLFSEGENENEALEIKGIAHTFKFNQKKLEEHRETIIALLNELPPVFKEGYTFLNLCLNKDQKQWTGEHFICEKLVVMAIGLNLMIYCFPEFLWSSCPGGVPYVCITM